MNRRVFLAALAGLLGLALVGGGLGGYAFWRSRRPLREIRIRAERSGTPQDNELMVLEPIERAVAQTDGMRTIRGEATRDGVSVSVLFPDTSDAVVRQRSLEHVRAYLKGAAKSLPIGLPPPAAEEVPESQTYYARTHEAVALAAPGVVAVETCGKSGPERVLVHLDTARLAAFGLDLAHVKDALAAERPFTRRGAVDADVLGATLLRGAPAPVALRDVATLTTAAGRSSCDVFSLDGALTYYHVIAVQKEHEAPLFQQARVHAVPLLGEDAALRLTLRFPPEADRTLRMQRMLAILPALRDVPGLTLHGAFVRDGLGEVIFATTKDSPPAAVEALRAIVLRAEGVAWGGVRGPLARGLHRLEVTVTDGLAADRETLVRDAREVAKRVAAVPGIGAPLRDVPVDVPTPLVELESTGLQPTDAEWLTSLLLAADDAESTIVVLAPDAERGARFRGQPVGGLVHRSIVRQRARITHVDLQEAVLLGWETSDPGTLRRVQKALAGLPRVAVRLD